MAPEILERFPAYGTKCDLWSTGVVLFVLLGGYHPFDGDTEDEIFDRMRNAQYDFYPDYWNPVSVSAKNLIVRMLTVNPTNRISASQALGHEWMNSANEVLSVGSIPSAISIAGAVSISSEVTMVPEIASTEVATVPEITSSEVTLPSEVTAPSEVIALKAKEQIRDLPRVIFIPSVVSTLSEVTMPLEIISRKGPIPSEFMTAEQIPASSIFESETSVGLGEHGIDHKVSTC
jgi:serine/threonine protein kinase